MTPALTFVGGGVMAEAMIHGILAHGLTGAESVRVVDVLPQRLEHLAAAHGVTVFEQLRDAVPGADVVVLAVKPQQIGEVGPALRNVLQPEQLVLSIAAGVTLGSLAGKLGHGPIVRAMPNTPAQIGQGITAWTATDQVSDAQHDLAAAVLGALGHEHYLEDEHHLDAVTAVSGSGPAYVFLFIEALIDAGVQAGLSRPVASDLAIQTVVGAALMLQQSGRHPADLRNGVTSPGGTTAAALAALERGGLRSAIGDAVAAARARSRELAD
jgi:pyrroline-5-carboxylate reductase